MSELKKIVALLQHEDAERRVAAAVVLGELKPKDAFVVDGLRALAVCGRPIEERAALDAIGRVGAQGKATAELWRALVSPDARVREAGGRALVRWGEAAVPKIRERMAKADDVEKRGLDAVLAELGGKDAFDALLDGLSSSDADTARAAALGVRQQVKEADPKQRRAYVATTTKFLKRKGLTPDTIAAALKILGYLEDRSALPVLVERAGEGGGPATVRQEAIIAMRFVLGADHAPQDVAKVLLQAAQGTDRSLARTALDTLAGLALDDAAVPVFARLAGHEEVDRAHFAIEKLRRTGGAAAAKALVGVVVETERGRAIAAKDALAGIPEATTPIFAALLSSTDADKSKLLAEALKPRIVQLTKAQRQKVTDALVAKLAAQLPGAEALLQIAREADPDGTADALRALAADLKKKKKDDRAQAVLFLLSRSDGATDDDRARLAVMELLKSRLDPTPHARAHDDALRRFEELAAKGADVVAVVKKDKRLTLEHLFYLGFHFVEEDDPLGEELLAEVIAKGGRTKLAKAARNKLKLAVT